MGWEELLVWLGGVGAVIAFSWISEYFGWFANVESKNKKAIYFGSASLIAIAAKLIIAFVPKEILVMIAPYVDVVIIVFTYIFIGDGFHIVTKNKE